MSHFEYMEKQGQLTIFEFLTVHESDHEPQVDRKPSTVVNKVVDKKKYRGAIKRGYIVRRKRIKRTVKLYGKQADTFESACIISISNFSNYK